MGPLYRMVVADVDGTLLGRGGRASGRVRAAVTAAQRAGALVVLATGRWFRSAQPIALDLGIELPIILHNGALVKDPRSGAVVDHCHLSSALAHQAIDLIRRRGLQPIVYENAFQGEMLLAGPVEHDSVFTGRYLATKTEHLRRLPLGELRLAADPLQLVVADTAERADPLCDELRAGPWRTVTSMSLAVPEARFVEVLSPECSKARATARLASSFGIAIENVLAIGDNYNDLDMIEAAGLGLAMGNAPVEVQMRADAVMPTVDEDGLAVAIERYVLDGVAAIGRSSPGGGAGSTG